MIILGLQRCRITSYASFERAVRLLRESLQRAGRDPATFPISKRGRPRGHGQV